MNFSEDVGDEKLRPQRHATPTSHEYELSVTSGDGGEEPETTVQDGFNICQWTAGRLPAVFKTQIFSTYICIF